MNKQDTLQSLENARRNLEFNLQTANSLLSNKEVGTLPSTDKNKCPFGIWLTSPEYRIKALLGPIFYKDLDTYHTQWCEEYSRIHLLIFEGLESTEKRKKISQMELDKGKLYFDELQRTTDKLIKALASSKRRLEALAEEKFEG